MIIRTVGDVHGKIDRYFDLIRDSRYSVCLGEMGFDLKPLISEYLRENLHCDHWIVPGNHDHYGAIQGLTSFLCNPGYGSIFNYGDFYVRGAQSIDKWDRTEGVDWFSEEELGTVALYDALEMYNLVRPRVMFTHTCPDSMVRWACDGTPLDMKSRTEQALQAMYEIHQPELWVFGHFHPWGLDVPRSLQVDDTEFVCLGELGCIDIELTDTSVGWEAVK